MIFNMLNQNKIAVQPWYYAEIFFREASAIVNILDKTPSLETVLRILTKTHRSKYANVKNNWIENELDAAEWLDRILKIDAIVELTNSRGKTFKIGIDVTLNDRHIEKKMEEISQPNFRQARRKLGIDRHWVVVLPANFQEMSAFELLARFETEIEKIDKRAVINFK